MWCYLKFELGLVGSAVNQFSCRTQRQFPRQLSKAIGSGSGSSWRVGIGTWGGCGSCAAPTSFFSFGTTFPIPSTFLTSLASSITKSSSWPAHQTSWLIRMPRKFKCEASDIQRIIFDCICMCKLRR